MRDTDGFTLVEILVTIAILSILLGIAGLSARDWVIRYQVESQTRQVYADLMNARVNAMQRNRVFFVSVGANQYAIYEDSYPSPDGNGNLDTGAGQDRLVIQKAAQYTLVSSPTATFNFTANGLASSATAAVVDIHCQSTANPASDCIEVSLTRILMGKWNGSTCITQ